jgi:hypothetical protein
MIGRKVDAYRKSKTEELLKNYIPSETVQKIIQLYKERDARKEADKAMKIQLEALAKPLNIILSEFTPTDEAINKVKKAVITSTLPKLDLDEALDELLIASIDDDFNPTDFITNYVEKIEK